jgi:type I restriction enzyme S subunit
MAQSALANGWRIYPFSEIADSITERVDDPSASGLEHYVGLEHLDPDTPRISRWGTPSDVEATKLRFYPGDVIYARRRAYQRKLGVADWDGIASAHALVLRARPEVCLPGFLPFFLQSDQFHRRALDISVGSLSPTINWKTLSVQKFALPPTSDQVAIVELLGAFERTRSLLVETSSSAQQFRDALMADPELHSAEEPLGSLLLACDYGISVAPQDRGDVPILRMNNLEGGELVLDDLRWIPAAGLQDADLVEPDDILFNRTNSIDLVGKVALVPHGLEPMAFASYLIRLQVDRKRVLPAFVVGFLQSAVGRSRISRFITRGVSQANVNSSNLKRVMVPVPPMTLQEQVVQQWQAVRDLQDALRSHTAETVSMAAVIREELLAGGVH